MNKWTKYMESNRQRQMNSISKSQEKPTKPPSGVVAKSFNGSTMQWEYEHVPPPSPPDNLPGYIAPSEYSHLRPADRPLGRPMPTDTSHADFGYEMPSWWQLCAGFWIAVSVGLVIWMLYIGIAH